MVTARRIVGRLHVVVEDDGRGLPEGFDLDASTQLGLSIVRTLVESELGGVLEIGPGTRGHPRAGRPAASTDLISRRLRRCGCGRGRCGA